MPDTDSNVRASNSGLKRTFQKLLLKRTSKPSKTRTHTGQLPDNGSLAQRDAQLDSADNSVVTQPSDQLNSWLDTHAQQESPFRAPAPPVGSDEDGTGIGTDQASLASEEVASHLDALGWEQATRGGSVTAEYWQFAPRENAFDITSAASQHSNSEEAVTPGLRTPPSAFERRRKGTRRQNKKEGVQPAAAGGSPGLSPVSSIQLQHSPGVTVRPASPGQVAAEDIAHAGRYGNKRNGASPTAALPFGQQQPTPFASIQQQQQQQQRPKVVSEQLRRQAFPASSNGNQQASSQNTGADQDSKQNVLFSQPPSAAWSSRNTNAAATSNSQQAPAPPGATSDNAAVQQELATQHADETVQGLTAEVSNSFDEIQPQDAELGIESQQAALSSRPILASSQNAVIPAQTSYLRADQQTYTAAPVARSRSRKELPPSPLRPPLDRYPSSTLSRGPSAPLGGPLRTPSYPLARNPSSASLASSLAQPHGITSASPSCHTSLQGAASDRTHDSLSHRQSSLLEVTKTPQQQQPQQQQQLLSRRRSFGTTPSSANAVQQDSMSNRSLPTAGAGVAGSVASTAELVSGTGPATSLVEGSAILDSMTGVGVVQGSDSQSGSRSSGPAGSQATAWVHSHTSQQLAGHIKGLASQVVTARSRQAQELAILKLYAVLSQAHFVKQQAADWEGAFLGILALPFPLFLKHTADVVIHPDRGYSNMVRGMAAAILKSIARWMEGQLDHGGPCHSLVQSVLTQLVQEANPGSSRYSGAQGPTIHENVAWDSILPTQQSILATEPEVAAGMGQLLDSGTLDGMLDTDVTSIVHQGRPDHRQPRWGVLETPNLLATGSVLDSEAWPEGLPPRSEGLPHRPEGLPPRQPGGLSRPPSIMETGVTQMVLDTQDVAEYGRSHAKGLRLTFWLFKTDQEDAWYAASSLVGSMASLGEAHIDAMGGMKLVKPLFLVLRRGGKDCKAAALRALQHLTTERACRAMTARQDSYLNGLVKAVQQSDTAMQYPATIILARLISNDPSTHYIVAQAGLIQALAKLMKQGSMPIEVREALTESVKHLTASSQKNRDTLVASMALPLFIAQLQTGEEAVQYGTARVLRHLALGSQPHHKTAALSAIVPLTQALQVGRPRVQFACASALAMLVEGHPEMCPQVLRHGGIAALTIMLQTAGAQGKKAAAEALQAVAAEDVDMKPRIAKSGAIPPLVAMVKAGNLQQQAAAAGALQALTYCPGRTDISAGIAGEGGIAPLVAMVTTGPLPLRSAAAGALCNLALANPPNQAAIIKAGALPALIQLLQHAQPDGQYAAAAALYNLAGQEPEVRLAIVACKALPALMLMLQAESWYCRIVAAEVLGRVCMEWANREAVQAAGAIIPLLNLLRLKHSPGMIDNVEGPVHHLAYERGEDVIVMKGYKFAKAKTAAAAVLGCLALANPAVADQLVKAGVTEQLMGMVESSSAEVRSVAAACLGDLAAAYPPLQPYLIQRLSKLVRLMSSNFRQAGSSKRPDVAAAGAAVGLLVAQQATAREGLLQLGGLKPLMAMLHQGTLAEQSVAANVLFDMEQGSEEAAQLIQGQGARERMHSLVASTDTPAAAAGGGTAALLHNTSLLDYAGFAMTAKPSVNLLVLLQIPFEELTPAKSVSQPHSLVPDNLLMTTVQSLNPVEPPPTSLAPLALQNNGNLSPESIISDESGQSESEQEEEEEPDSPLESLYPQQGDPGMTPTSRAPLSGQPSWGGYSSLQPAFSFRSSHSQGSSGQGARPNLKQEQWSHPVAGQFQQQAARQHILDTYVG